MSLQEIVDVANKYKAVTGIGLLVGGFFGAVLVGAVSGFTQGGTDSKGDARVDSLIVWRARDSHRMNRMEEKLDRNLCFTEALYAGDEKPKCGFKP